MTAARHLTTTRTQLDQPTPTVPGQLALDHHLAYEEWPDGTFGGTRQITGWTSEQQAAHRNALEAALRTPAA